MKVPWKILLIVGLGLGLRLWGINFGLPHLYHADEPIVVNHALAYGTGDLHPHFFKIPPLVSYLLFIGYGKYFLIGKALGWFHSVADFEGFFLADPTSFYLVGRIFLGAVFGTLTIFLLYRLAARYFSELHGLLSAFFLAVCFLHVRDSHYIYVDIPLVLVLTACFFPIFGILDRGSWKDYLAFSVVFGTTVATKYNGVFMFVPFLVAHALRIRHCEATFQARPKQSTSLQIASSASAKQPFRVGLLAMTGAVSVFTYFLLNPYSLLDWQFFLKELLTQGKSESHVGIFHHLFYSLNGGLGVALGTAALLGMAWTLFRPEKKRLIFLSFILIYYWPVLVFFSQPYDRYALSLIPFFAFFAADFLVKIRDSVRVFHPLVLTAAFLIAVPSLAKIVLSNHLFNAEDNRTVAQEWLEANIPAGGKIALDIPFYLPRLKPTLSQLEEKKRLLSGGLQSKERRIDRMIEEAKKNPGEKRYELYFLKDKPGEGFIFSEPSLPFQIEELKSKGVHYVVIPRIHEKENPFYSELREKGKLAARFTPYKDATRDWAVDSQPLTGGPFLWEDLIARERNGQIIEVYELA